MNQNEEDKISKHETITLNDVIYVRKDSIKEPSKMFDGMKYGIVRSEGHGVLAGFIEKFEGQTVHLRRARRIWKWVGAKTLEEIAVYGPSEIEKCFIGPEVEHEVMLEACGIIYCTAGARRCLQEAKEWKQ